MQNDGTHKSLRPIVFAGHLSLVMDKVCVAHR
jgi:hypothetical protein